MKYYFRVSTLSHVEFCPKRAKLETFNKFKCSNQVSNPIKEGNRLHKQYSYARTNFDREIIRSRLELFKINRAFQKEIGNIIIRGDYDDFRVILYNLEKYVSFVEVKTTSKKYMWHREIKAAVKQLQLYLWMLKDLLESIGYKLWKRHYVEVYSQQTGELLKRIPVEYNGGIEEWIYDVIDQFNGTAKMSVPPRRYCNLCPKVVKEMCSWNKMMKKT